MSPKTPQDTSEINPSDESKEGDSQNDQNKTASGPLQILFPPDLPVWNEARRLASDVSIRVEDLATCASQDPAIVIDFLKISNGMYFSAGRQPITSTRTAIQRLGSDVILETLEKMKERPQILDPNVQRWFEIHRSCCKRASLVARILSESVAKTLADECQTVGLLLHVGEMLAVHYLGDRYVKMGEELARSSINYRLSQDFKFDVERMRLQYLRRNGIPEAILFALDRDGRSKSAERATIKPLCMAAGELVEAFDANKWDKFAPGKNLPPKSAVRMLGFSENQYLKIYERISEYLFAMRVFEEKKRRDASKVEEPPKASFPQPQPANNEEAALQSEINEILSDGAANGAETSQKAPSPKAVAPQSSAQPTVDPTTAHEEDQFSIAPSQKKQKPNARRTGKSRRIDPPKLVNQKAAAVVTSIAEVLNASSNSEELLSQILAMLVDNGPFHKSALIVVSKDRKKAIVVAARGPSIGNGQKLDIDDPLNPLAQCFSKVQSFGNKESKISPFGSKSFAVAPIDADHETPVALYADCGKEGAISFEARRVFRTVVEILNERLPDIPGGIPIEL